MPTVLAVGVELTRRPQNELEDVGSLIGSHKIDQTRLFSEPASQTDFSWTQFFTK
jgi:hypothetical protein